MKGKDEGGRMKDEVKAVLLSFILHPSAFILYLAGAGRFDLRFVAEFFGGRRGGVAAR
jgi:hypothetical protein